MYRFPYVPRLLNPPQRFASNSALAIVLTTWHLTFATIMTQILARTTTVLDGRKTVKMTGRVYLRAIVPIGLMFSLSLICGNMTYLYLSVAFIQMLKVRLEPRKCPMGRNFLLIVLVGHYSRCCPSCYLGYGHGSRQLQDPHERFDHRHWCRHCFIW